jgi:hypothetical protein
MRGRLRAAGLQEVHAARLKQRGGSSKRSSSQAKRGPARRGLRDAGGFTQLTSRPQASGRRGARRGNGCWTSNRTRDRVSEPLLAKEGVFAKTSRSEVSRKLRSAALWLCGGASTSTNSKINAPTDIAAALAKRRPDAVSGREAQWARSLSGAARPWARRSRRRAGAAVSPTSVTDDRARSHQTS